MSGMATALAAFVAGDLFAPDAFTRVVNKVSGKRAEYRRLKSAVRQQAGVRPGRAYRRWISQSEIWDNVVRDPVASYDNLVESLLREWEKRLTAPWRPIDAAEEREQVVRLVDATIANLIASLDAPRAVAAVDVRMRAGLQEIKDTLDTRTSFEERLQRLPAPTADALRKANDSDDSDTITQLLLILESDNSPDSIQSLATSPPSWVRNASAHLWSAIAEYLWAHSRTAPAACAFEEVSKRGIDRSRNLALAALAAQEAGLSDRATDLLAQAREVDGQPDAVALITAIFENDVATLADYADRATLPDKLLASIVGEAVLQRNGPAGAVAYYRRIVSTFPELAGLKIRLAQLLLHESQTKDFVGDRSTACRESLKLAVEARDLRRNWRGPSAPAVEVACQALLIMLDYAGVLQLGRLKPAGDATEEEAASAQVRRLAVEAALANDDVPLATELLTLVADQYDRNLLLGQILASSSDRQEEAVSRLTTSLTTAQTDEDKLVAWAALASTGAELPLREELEARDDEYSATILAQWEAARGADLLAITRLRTWRNRSPRAAEQLAHIYRLQGNTDSAVDTFKSATETFNDPRFLVSAAVTLYKASQLDDAESMALSTLPAVQDQVRQATVLHEILVVAAQKRRHWTLMASRTRKWIADCGSTSERRWYLVGSLYNDRLFEQAWIELQSQPALAPVDEAYALVWVDMNARFRPGPEFAVQALDMVRHSGFSTDFIAAVIGRLITIPHLQLPEALSEAWRETISAFTESNPSHSSFTSIKVPDDAEGIVNALRPHLETYSRIVNDAAERVSDGRLPYGMLAVVSNRRYASILAMRAAGFFPITPEDPSVVAAEVQAARDAVDRPIIMDLSAIAINRLVPDLWPTILQVFYQISMPSCACIDLAQAVDDSKGPPTGSLGWDATSGIPRVSEPDTTEHVQLQERLIWMDNAVRDLNKLEWPNLRSAEFGEELRQDPRMYAWLAPSDVSLYQRLPLFADDVVIRGLARSVGVQTFGTYALLRVLSERELVDSLRASYYLDTLLKEYCTDIPFDGDMLVRVAANDDWAAAGAAFAFTRKSTWRNAPAAHETWNKIVSMAGSYDPELIPAWVHRATLGITISHSGVPRNVLVAGVLNKALLAVGFRKSIVPALVEAARAAVSDKADFDPLIEMVKLFKATAADGDPAVAARILLEASSELAEVDRSTVRALIFSK